MPSRAQARDVRCAMAVTGDVQDLDVNTCAVGKLEYRRESIQGRVRARLVGLARVWPRVVRARGGRVARRGPMATPNPGIDTGFQQG